MGIDAIKRVQLLEPEALEKSMNFRLGDENLLITFHPVTVEGQGSSIVQIQGLLDALAELFDAHLVFTMPNTDTGGRQITRMVREFEDGQKNASVHSSLGQLRYFSCIAQVDGVTGNSSSGLLEASTF